MLKPLGLLFAMISSVPAAPDRAQKPIQLLAQPGSDGVRFQVIGHSPREFRGTFTLAVTRGGNQSVHRGSAWLTGGEKVVLSTVTVGGAPGQPWRATLSVDPEGGETYEEVHSSS